MMNSMQPSGALARSRLGTATKKMLALLLAAVMFLMLGVVGVMVTRAEELKGTLVTYDELTDGDYLIVDRYSSSYDYYALGNSTAGSSGSYGYSGTTVTVSGNSATLTNGSSANVWTYRSSDKSLYNAASGKYLNLPSSSSNASSFFSSNPVTLSLFKISDTEIAPYISSGNGGYYLNASYPSSGKAFSSAYARYINSNYLSSGSGVYFYKLEAPFEKPENSSETISNVDSISVKKTWQGTPSKNTVTVGLYNSTNGQLVEEKSISNGQIITFSNLSSSKSYYIAEEEGDWEINYGTPSITSHSKTGWFEVEKGNVEAGNTYAFVYSVNGTDYLLSGNGTTLTGATSGLTNGVPNESISNSSLWVPSVCNSYYGTWDLQNLQSKNYLNYQAAGWSISPNLSSSKVNSYYGWHVDTDGSIWNEYNGTNQLFTTNGTVFSAESSKFTEFTPYIYGTSTTSTATYSITNTPTSVTPTESTYSLTYDANGGSGAPDADSKTDTNSTKGFTVSSAKPTRESYDFLGWADNATATTANYQPGDPISLTGNKTIYAVWKEQEKPIEDPMPDFHKSITPTNQVSDNYTIQLNVTGKDKRVTSTTPGETVTETKPVDIVLVIDQTYSMNSTLSDGKTRLAAVQEAAKQFVSNLDVNEKSKISLISYECYNDDTRKTPVYVRQDWTPVTSSAKASLTSKIDALTLTNYPRAYYTYYAPPLEQTADLLTASSVTNDGNKKYVIFFSDGEASDTYESELAQVKANSTVFAVGVESNDFMASTDKIKSVASDSSKYYEVGNTAEFVEAFNEALQTITSENTSTSSAIHLNNITISDTLSDYVELSNTNASNNYGITVDNLTKDQYTVTVSGKTVTVKLKDNVTLEDGKTYTVNIPVKPTAKAQTEADAANANTSTFPSNTTASITYKYDGDPTTKNYTETPNILVAKTKTYTVTWKNEDGTVLETDTGLKLGDTPEYNGETPTKEKSNGLVYVFDGWDKEISPVNGDTTYIAKFKEVPQTDYVLHKTSHAMFILSGLCAATAGAMFAVEHYRRKRLTP